MELIGEEFGTSWKTGAAAAAGLDSSSSNSRMISPTGTSIGPGQALYCISITLLPAQLQHNNNSSSSGTNAANGIHQTANSSSNGISCSSSSNLVAAPGVPRISYDSSSYCSSAPNFGGTSEVSGDNSCCSVIHCCAGDVSSSFTSQGNSRINNCCSGGSSQGAAAAQRHPQELRTASDMDIKPPDPHANSSSSGSSHVKSGIAQLRGATPADSSTSALAGAATAGAAAAATPKPAGAGAVAGAVAPAAGPSNLLAGMACERIAGLALGRQIASGSYGRVFSGTYFGRKVRKACAAGPWGL